MIIPNIQFPKEEKIGYYFFKVNNVNSVCKICSNLLVTSFLFPCLQCKVWIDLPLSSSVSIGYFEHVNVGWEKGVLIQNGSSTKLWKKDHIFWIKIDKYLFKFDNKVSRTTSINFILKFLLQTLNMYFITGLYNYLTQKNWYKQYELVKQNFSLILVAEIPEKTCL